MKKLFFALAILALCRLDAVPVQHIKTPANCISCKVQDDNIVCQCKEGKKTVTASISLNCPSKKIYFDVAESKLVCVDDGLAYHTDVSGDISSAGAVSVVALEQFLALNVDLFNSMGKLLPTSAGSTPSATASAADVSGFVKKLKTALQNSFDLDSSSKSLQDLKSLAESDVSPANKLIRLRLFAQDTFVGALKVAGFETSQTEETWEHAIKTDDVEELIKQQLQPKLNDLAKDYHMGLKVATVEKIKEAYAKRVSNLVTRKYLDPLKKSIQQEVKAKPGSEDAKKRMAIYKSLKIKFSHGHIEELVDLFADGGRVDVGIDLNKLHHHPQAVDIEGILRKSGFKKFVSLAGEDVGGVDPEIALKEEIISELQDRQLNLKVQQLESFAEAVIEASFDGEGVNYKGQGYSLSDGKLVEGDPSDDWSNWSGSLEPDDMLSFGTD